MADTAAHLVDFVIPHVPVRQWVLSMPRPLRFILARDSKLITRATNIFVSEIFRSQRQRADLPRPSDAECGAVTGLRHAEAAVATAAQAGVQRFGGALNANVHLHSLVLDGVYPKGDRTSFRRTPEPSQEELMEVLERTRSRITAWLSRKGFAWESEEGGGEGEELSVQDVIQAASIREWHPAEARRVRPAFAPSALRRGIRLPLASRCSASEGGWIGLSDEARRVLVLGDEEKGAVPAAEKPFTVRTRDGWNLHAAACPP